jgi:hypothetical protein
MRSKTWSKSSPERGTDTFVSFHQLPRRRSPSLPQLTLALYSQTYEVHMSTKIEGAHG